MPTIAVNLGAVKDEYESLPIGKYLGEVEKAVLKEASERGKFDQLMVQNLVIEGDLTGRKQSIWLSFSPKAAFMMKRFFSKFGLGDIPDLVFDDDTNELIEPDLAGYRIIFEVKPDRKDPERLRTELVSVEDEGAVAAPPPKVPTVTRAPKAAPAAVAEEPVVDAKAAAKAARIAAAEAALAAAAADDDDEEAEEAEAAPVAAPAARPAPRPAPAARTAPARRTLR